VLGGAPPDERLAGTLGAVCWARMAGSSLVRVHDVRVTLEALAVVDALARG
jgi:dihydropteroate synthase